MRENNWSVAITGSGGSGSVTAGMILLEALALKGLHGVMTRSYGPQIRGGESAVMIRFGDEENQTQADKFDVLISLDWEKIERFVEEIPLDGNSIIIGDLAAGEVPKVLIDTGAKTQLIEYNKEMSSVENGRSNMLALGILGSWIGISCDHLTLALQKVLGNKSDAILYASRQGVLAGMETGKTLLQPLDVLSQSNADKRWIISGNEACAFGAVLGGIRFVAAYPITPATDLLEWLASRLEKINGTLLQAEDELASINMVIGSSFGGVPSLTATSGPGLSLMSEALGLAVASEIPLVVVNVSRGGPSTGIPTKSEQSDLNIAIYGLHGDAPHIVLAPLNIADCVFTTQWAVQLAESLQSPAIVLTDQMMAQARVVVEAPEITNMGQANRLRAISGDAAYQRYKLLDTGVSPMSFPGDEGMQYTADGLEHNERGTPSSLASDHLKQSQKRRRKLEEFDYGPSWAEVDGKDETTVLLTWGSSSDVVREAAERLRFQGLKVKTICLRLLSPMPVIKLKQEFVGVSRCVVIELNESAQLYHYLASYHLLPDDSRSFCRPGPLFFRPVEIVNFMRREFDHVN